MKKLMHHFWFKTVVVSSFSFLPVKSFSSEKNLLHLVVCCFLVVVVVFSLAPSALAFSALFKNAL